MTRTRITGFRTALELKHLVMNEMEMHGATCDLNHIDISEITHLDEVFKNSCFNGDMSQWNTSNVYSMNGTFVNSAFDGNISAWNVGRLQYASSMFENSKFNGDISRWDVSHVKNMFRMFANSVFNGDISNWNVYLSSASSMATMFSGASFSGDLSRWPLVETPQVLRMLDCSFTGTLPLLQGKIVTMCYINLFGTRAKLSTYLKNTAFNTVHLDMCHATKRKPLGVNPDDYKWFKNIHQLGLGLGLPTEEFRNFAMAERSRLINKPFAETQDPSFTPSELLELFKEGEAP